MNGEIDLENIFLLFLTIVTWACFRNVFTWLFSLSSYNSFLIKFFKDDADTFNNIFHVLAYVITYVGTGVIGACALFLLSV